MKILENLENHILDVFKENIGNSRKISFRKYYDTVDTSIISSLISSVKSGRSEVIFRIETAKFTSRNGNPRMKPLNAVCRLVVYIGENVTAENATKNKDRSVYKTASFIAGLIYSNPYKKSYGSDFAVFLPESFSTPFRDEMVDVGRYNFIIDVNFLEL